MACHCNATFPAWETTPAEPVETSSDWRGPGTGSRQPGREGLIDDWDWIHYTSHRWADADGH